ncbi:MAG: hypothetical protein ABSA92_14940 [Candidatus Bathyarchaeia archaeon]
MVNRQRSPSGWLIVGLLLLSSILSVVQLGISQSYGQYVTQTTYLPGLPTTWRVHTGNRTWTHMGNHTWIHTGNRTFTRPGNLTWVHTGNQTWTWIHTNQTWTQLGNLTERKRGPPSFMNGWARSNMTVATRNETQAFLLNGTYDIRLGSIAIYASSSGQVIRSVAFNDSVVQVEFDREGSVQLVINSSAKPSQVFADNNTLTMTQSISGLTPASEAWVYDQSSHTLIILADPMSITLIYGTTTSTPIPEFPAALELMIAVGCLAIMLIIRKALNEHYTSQSAARTG